VAIAIAAPGCFDAPGIIIICPDPRNGLFDPTCCATFGPHVETQEHCNAFVYYYPKLDDATCF